MDINCNSNEFILIGWSHYGTKKSGGIHSSIKHDQQRYEYILFTYCINNMINNLDVNLLKVIVLWIIHIK
jgi:hypothetical protein